MRHSISSVLCCQALDDVSPTRSWTSRTVAACPGCAKPLYGLLRAAAAGDRAGAEAGGGVRPGGMGEKGVCTSYPSTLAQRIVPLKDSPRYLALSA